MRVLESREIVVDSGRVVIKISESLDGSVDIEVSEYGGTVRINDPRQKDGRYFFFWKNIQESK